MIWHIFRKDLRLLWPLALIVTAVHLLNAGLLAYGHQFSRLSMSGLSDYGWLSNNALPLLSLLGLIILVIALMQQDRLPGTTQDWLTRPIRRSQLFTEKLIFILLVGLGPLLAGDLWMGMAEHLRIADVFAASLTRSGVLFCMICLPAVLIGAVTRSQTGALMFVLGLIVVLVIEVILLTSLRASIHILQAEFSWIAQVMWICLSVAAVVVLLPLQLRWRSTNRVRWILAACFCLAPAAMCLPFRTAFSIQQALSHPAASVTIDPKLDTTQRMTFSIDNSRVPAAFRKPPEYATVNVPIVAPDSNEPWQIDDVRLRAVDSTGGRWSSTSIAYFYPRRLGGPQNRLAINVPIKLFQSARDGHVNIEATLFITSFKLAAKKPLHSLDGGSIDEFSRCQKQVFRSGRFVNCVSTRPVATCTEYDYKNRAELGLRQRVPFTCSQAAYDPWPLPLWRDAYYAATLGGAMSVREENIVGELQSLDQDPMVSNFEPDAHFIRTLEFGVDAATEGPLLDAAKSIDGLGAAARFVNPGAMASDRHGNLYVADLDDVIRKVTPAGDVTTLAGLAGEPGRDDGPAASARFRAPRGLAVDAADNIYVADTGNHLIRKISPGGMVSTIAGNTGAAASGDGVLHDPSEIVCASDGTLYVMDRNENHKPVLLKISADGSVSKIAGPDIE
jgi:NHL repeat